MKDSGMSKKHKRARSPSNSSHYTISDDDSPKHVHKKDDKKLEEKHYHRKHHKHNRRHKQERNSDDSSDDGDVRNKHKVVEKEKRHKYGSPVRVKEEPVSEDERNRKYKDRHAEQSRSQSDASRRTKSDFKHSKDDSRSRSEHTTNERSGSDRTRRPIKEEPQGNSEEPEWGKKDIKKEKKEPVKNNAKPDFGLSGKLTEDANTFNGVVIKYSEPPEARKPKRRWRLYPFKGETSLPILHIHRQSAYLLGRDRKVADIPIDHPSCSKQHAALQYRLVPFTRSDGSSGKQIKLYVIDLESANGTYLNNQKIEPKKYYELKERDVVKFGYSSREYVLLHEHSKDSEEDDNVNNED